MSDFPVGRLVAHLLVTAFFLLGASAASSVGPAVGVVVLSLLVWFAWDM